jgi:hypothetical protein
MTDPVDLDAKRKAKAPRCELCAGPAHEHEAQCPRVIAITYEADGGITYHLLVLAGADPHV